ncbi:methyltransferase-like protein 9 [Mizuhopecten yessoensis]|uniref:Methyltransferase-like protein 9 n=1 Tax=Mizuhopecten yessoensis TaxID=6573 RepID=A0A210QH13_MIZYE|nr:methyltransferase-like protein 9 [Mizuhopecten yessoensis]OWF48006.1 Methyltransferase-like protein 9 [Mizuhopecten yessoensis]
MVGLILFLSFLHVCFPLVPGMAEEGFTPARHLRSPMLRAVYNRLQEDQRHQNDQHEYWYAINTTELPEDLCKKAIQFYQDEDTSNFLDNCYEKADWIFTQISHSLSKSLLSWFMTGTSVNGLLQRGSMFVFSDSQLQQLLQIDDSYRGRSMIDLGAGDGLVTDKMAKYFETVYATEVSTPMRWRLQNKGYTVLEIDQWGDGSMKYDLIGCLNLLDRCDKPITILHTIRKSLTPSGRAIVAVVLPFRPYVEQGTTDHKPTENIMIQGKTFEDQCKSFVESVFEPAGFEVEKFSRLPYLCEGDMHQSFYMLQDAVFVLKLKEEG